MCNACCSNLSDVSAVIISCAMLLYFDWNIGRFCIKFQVSERHIRNKWYTLREHWEAITHITTYKCTQSAVPALYLTITTCSWKKLWLTNHVDNHWYDTHQLWSCFRLWWARVSDIIYLSETVSVLESTLMDSCSGKDMFWLSIFRPNFRVWMGSQCVNLKQSPNFCKIHSSFTPEQMWWTLPCSHIEEHEVIFRDRHESWCFSQREKRAHMRSCMTPLPDRTAE